MLFAPTQIQATVAIGGGQSASGAGSVAGAGSSPSAGGSSPLDVFLPEAFGTVGGADDTAALLGAVAAIQAAGRGTLKLTKPNYNVTSIIGDALFTFTNLNGVVLDFKDSLITDLQVYAGAQFQSGVLFKFVNCQNITIAGRISSQIAVTTNAGTTLARGLIACQFLQGCKNINLDLDVTGGEMAVNATRLFNDPEGYRSSRFRGRISATGTYYAWAAQFSGDDADLLITTDTCGRSFYTYGVSNQTLNVRAHNQQVTSLMWAFSGVGCRDMRIHFVDRDSDANQAAAPRIQIGFGDLTPAAHANMDIRFDVKNPAGSPFASTLEFIKYSDGGTTPDAVGRGHVIDGLRISGLSDQQGGVNHVQQGAGAFAAPDVCRNLAVRDLTLIGNNSAFAMGSTSPISQLQGRAIFENVISTGHNIQALNGANGEVVFIGCQALNFSSTVNDTDVHTLVCCNATDGSVQSIINKLFVRTFVGALLRDDHAGLGGFVRRASKQLSGDITGAAQNIFKVSAIANGALFILRYFLVNDQGDSNPATRKEVEGVKSFSAFISAAGAWSQMLAFAQEIAERTLGLTPAVLTVSLVNGSAAGGFIAVTATNYNGANGKHTFMLEMIPINPATVLVPV